MYLRYVALPPALAVTLGKNGLAVSHDEKKGTIEGLIFICGM